MDEGILVKQVFPIKASERSKLLGVYFHNSQPNCEICGNDFYVPVWQCETCYNLVLQLMIFYVFKHVAFSVSKSNFHFKGKSRISTDSFNKTNLSIPQFNIKISNETIYHFQKFLWNSV